MSTNAILCVDDEAIILMSMVNELRRNFGDVFIYEKAINPEEAFEVIEDLLSDGIEVVLVISDWLMPGMRGDEFLQRINRKYPDINSILITGMADADSIERTLSISSVVTVLKKPWRPEQLIKAVKDCCADKLDMRN